MANTFLATEGRLVEEAEMLRGAFIFVLGMNGGTFGRGSKMRSNFGVGRASGRIRALVLRVSFTLVKSLYRVWKSF